MNNVLNPDFIKQVRLRLYRENFHAFVRDAWPNIITDEYEDNWHVEAICKHLQAIAEGRFHNRLLINVPPGMSKSTLVNIMYPAWLWGPFGNPEHKFIGAAHEQGLAVRDNRMMRELITSPWYQSLWPIVLQGDQNEKLYFENSHRGFRQACAVASMTGRRGHTVVWDDPLTPEKAHSETHRATANRIFKETLPLRLNDQRTSAIIIIMQRLHEDDVSGQILADGYNYEHICLPMEYDPDQHCKTSLPWEDPRTEDGELLFPARWPAKLVEGLKSDMGSFAVAGQFQQRPSPRGGGIFKDEWWRYYKTLPQLEWRSIYADTASKTKEQNDWSVFECWGKAKSGEAVMIDMIRGKWEAPELLANARAFWNKHKSATDPTLGNLRKLNIEDKASGTGLIQILQREKIPVAGIERNIDKVTRAYDTTPWIEAGAVLLPEDAPWLSDFLSEAGAFPNGKHDDMLDPMMDAVADICIKKRYTLDNL